MLFDILGGTQRELVLTVYLKLTTSDFLSVVNHVIFDSEQKYLLMTLPNGTTCVMNWE